MVLPRTNDSSLGPVPLDAMVRSYQLVKCGGMEQWLVIHIISQSNMIGKRNFLTAVHVCLDFVNFDLDETISPAARFLF